MKKIGQRMRAITECLSNKHCLPLLKTWVLNESEYIRYKKSMPV